MKTIQEPKTMSPIFIGRWTPKILFSLKEKPHRHGELRRRLEGVSQRMLTRTLRNLEIRRLDWQAYDAIESHCCRVLADSTGKDDPRSTRRHVPLGNTIPQGSER